MNATAAEGTLRDARTLLLAAVSGDGSTVDFMLGSYNGSGKERDQERGELLACLLGFACSTLAALSAITDVEPGKILATGSASVGDDGDGCLA